MTKKGIISTALALSVAWISGQAEAKAKSWKGKFSGSYISTEIDTNSDGSKASIGTLSGRSGLGDFTEQALGELAFVEATTCPNGDPGLLFALVSGTGHFVLRFDTGDLVWGEISSETSCLDSTTGIFHFSGETVVTGGTGKFAGATGSGQFSGENRHLFVYPSDITGRYFGEENGTFEGTIVTP